MSGRLTRAQRYGTTRRPVRASGDMLTNSPSGWMTQPPSPWSAGQGATWWIGQAIGGGSEPIGPNGPWPTTGATAPVITRATSLLVDPLSAGGFRVRVAHESSPAGMLIDPPRWLSDPMLLRPDSRYGASPLPSPERLARSVFWRLFLAQAVWWGRSFLYFLEDAAGAPVPGTMRLVREDLVSVDEGTGHWAIGDEYVFDADGRRNGGRLVCLHNPHTDVGVFRQHPEVFNLGDAMSTYTRSTFKAGVPAGYLKVTQGGLKQDQADELKAGWLKAHGGDERSVAVLNATTDFQPISWSPVDAALGEVKRLHIGDVAYAFGIAPETLGVTMGSGMTYANIQQYFAAHRDLSLSPWIGALQGCLGALLPEGSQVEVNLDAYTRPPMRERLDAYKVALDAGLFTVDEVREMEGMPPLPEPPPPAPVPPALEAAQGDETENEEDDPDAAA